MNILLNRKIEGIFVLLLLLIQFVPATLSAQNTYKINIKVVMDGKGVQGASVTIDNLKTAITNQYGKGEVILDGDYSQPTDVKVSKKGLTLETWGFNKRKKEVEVLLSHEQNELTGRVTDENGVPYQKSEIIVRGINSQNPVKTNSNGEFLIELPESTKITTKNIFVIEGKQIKNTQVKFDNGNKYVAIIIKEVVKKVVKSSNTNDNTVSENNSSTNGDDANKYRLPLKVAIFDEDGDAVTLATVFVDNQSFITDEAGEFTILSASFHNSHFIIDGFEVTSKNYNYKTNMLYLYVSSLKSTVSDNDTTTEGYAKNFNYVLNQLESRKQILGQKSDELRSEIEIIADKLYGEGQINGVKRAELEKYMHRLEDALIENDVAFEDAQFKTKDMLDDMKNTIQEKDSLNSLANKQIVKIEAQKEEVQRNLYLFSVLTFIMLVLAISSFYFARKNKAQKEELEVVNRDLLYTKEEVEKAHQDILTIRDIGQKITSALDFESHIITIYAGVNHLFDAPILGVGIANEDTNTLEFKAYMKDEEMQTPFQDNFNDNGKLSILCFNNQEEIIINDLETEYSNYITVKNLDIAEGVAKSLLFLPLVIEGKPIGVLTMQSHKKDAYRNMNMEVLNTLSSYVAIAAANANAYRIIKTRNSSITDSMRYAQTIQEAILPSQEEMDSVLQNYFVIYKSKEIVSGDFYWMTHFEDENGVRKTFLATIDCTGHGIPGAFMSMIGNTLLNEIVNHDKEFDTAKILKKMDYGVKNALKQKQKGNTDGMEISLCLLERQHDTTTKVTFSGAKSPLYYIRKNTGKLETIAGDKRPVGGLFYDDKEFTSKELILDKGDIIYLTTDGFKDQNNPNREKFGTPQFKELLEDNTTLPLSIQKEKIHLALLEHQKYSQQRDDITIVAVKMS